MAKKAKQAAKAAAAPITLPDEAVDAPTTVGEYAAALADALSPMSVGSAGPPTAAESVEAVEPRPLRRSLSLRPRPRPLW